MYLPFTREQFFAQFERYNTGVWPAHIALLALAVALLVLIYRGRPSGGRWVAAGLACLWAWMGIAYHFAYFTAINPAAWGFGMLSLAGALVLGWFGGVRGGVQFVWRRDFRGWIAVALVVFGLLVYPALGWWIGHRYPAVPTFGLPCPTTIFTIGILLFASGPVPRSLLVVPVLWAAVGSTAALALGVYEDLGLLVAGLIGLIAMSRLGPFGPGAAGRALPA